MQVQSRIKQLAKIERIEVDEVDTSHLSLRFPPAPRSGDFPLILEDVGKAYGEHRVFDHATFTLRRGEKVAFVGKNGEGKSTLVKCIMGEIPFTGDLRLGHNVKIGYFARIGLSCSTAKSLYSILSTVWQLVISARKSATSSVHLCLAVRLRIKR